MYPHSHPMYFYRPRPRRFLWFVLGGVAATLWLKGRDRDARSVDAPRGWWHACKGATASLRERREEETQWSEEGRRLARIGAQASETIVDVSETALDSILTAVETLKTKLAEQRLARQKIEDEHRRSNEGEELRRV